MAEKAKDATEKVQEVSTLSNIQKLGMTTELGKIQRKLNAGNIDVATSAILRFNKNHASLLRNNPELNAKVEKLAGLIFEAEPAKE